MKMPLATLFFLSTADDIAAGALWGEPSYIDRDRPELKD